MPEPADAARQTQQSWRVVPADPTMVSELQAALGCPRFVAHVLASRQITPGRIADTFLTPSLADLHDPMLLLGMPAAVERIRTAVTLGEPILIYGDYDVDGTTATVLLKTAIERIAAPDRPAQVTFHVPHRLREGYGMRDEILQAAARSGVRLVISVDTGIRAFAAAAAAKALALDLIVTDHHLPDSAEGVPEALAVINPQQAGCSYPNKQLCGAGVAFKLACALLASAAETEAQKDRLHSVLLPSFLKLVAIATIADSVSLTGENRAIVWLGLKALCNPVQPGLRALMRVAKLPLDASPTATEIGFRLAPRINAAGRMDIAADVVDLFLTRDPERAKVLAEKLDNLNQARRATEANALAAIDLQLSALRHASGGYSAECIVLDHPEWHRGVLGILASRVVDRTGRPALIMTTEGGDAHGSGRSIDGYHLLDALTAIHQGTQVADAPALFQRFGGHAHAVGFSLPSDRLPLLRERLTRHSRDLLRDDLLMADLRCDAEVAPEELTLEALRWLERCAPFGMGNREPVLIGRDLMLTGPPRLIQDRHVCLSLTGLGIDHPLNAMGWSRSGGRGDGQDWVARCAVLELGRGSRVDAAFRMRENKHADFGGLELELLDVVLSKGQPEAKAGTE